MISKALIIGGFMALAATTASANTLYSQAWNGNGVAYASQNDTNPGGHGAFATTYDDFTLGSAAQLNGVNFTGIYFSGSPGPISGFTLTFYLDAGGAPGAAIASGFFPGTGSETSINTGFQTYSYNLSFVNYGVTAGTYWLSLVPDIGFPPQWGWATSATGANNAYQCFFGTCGGVGANMAFDILGTTSVPEPATWALMLVGFGGLGLALRGQRRKTAGLAA